MGSDIEEFTKLKVENTELKAENYELKESLKCFQTPEAIKALTFYITGEFELQEKKCIELEQENARLKEEIKEYKKRSKCAWKCFEGTLCEEGEKYKQENKELAHYLACMTEQRNKANTYLQEIKAIAEAPKTFIDFSEIKTATEVEYDYAVICNELELRLHKILELITKAEEE